MKILITGFDPFGGESVNPAWQAVSALPSQLGEARLIKAQLPTVFKQSAQALFASVREHQPQAVICTGQAGGRYGISLERVAINLDDARIADNAGQQPLDSPIYPDGQAAYFSSLPIKATVASLQQAGIPAAVSNTAGTFVCNHVMYALLYYLHQQRLPIRGGFIHVPYLPEQTINKPNTPSMELSRIILALEIAVQTLCRYPKDIALTGGCEC